MVCVTDKKVVSVSLDEEAVEYLDKVSDNRSAFINGLLEDHRESKSVANEAVAEFRKKQLEQKKAAMESQLELFEDELEDIEETLQDSKQQVDAEIEEARLVLEDVPKDPSNPGVKNWARKLGMTPQELLDEIEDGGAE